MNRYMKRFLLIASLLVTLSLSASAQQLTVAKEIIDCGKTGYMVPVTATFELKNSGSRRLKIDDVKTDCGCSKASISKKELSGGETCVVKVTYDARMLGHFYKQALVTYHTRQGNMTQQSLYLTMQGVVLTEVKDYSATYPYAMGELLADKNVLEFDDVNRGDMPVQEINILNNGSKTMVPNLQHLPPYLSAVVTPEKLQPGRSGKVVVTLLSRNIHDFGLTQTSVYLASHLGDKVHPDNEVPISVVLSPDLKEFEGKNRQYAPKMVLSSDSVELGTVNGKICKKTVIVIRNQGRTELNISSLQMFTSGLQLTLDKRSLQPNEQTKLRIVGDLEKLKKARSKPRVLMITNDPDHSKVVISINVKK